MLFTLKDSFIQHLLFFRGSLTISIIPINFSRLSLILRPFLKVSNMNAEHESRIQSGEYSEINRFCSTKKPNWNVILTQKRYRPCKLQTYGARRSLYDAHTLFFTYLSQYCSFNPSFDRDVASFWWDNCSLWCLTRVNATSQRDVMSHLAETIIKMSFMKVKVAIKDQLLNNWFNIPRDSDQLNRLTVHNQVTCNVMLY